jgi:hypothetical protein
MRCVCGQVIAQGLSALGSVLCHDCRADPRRADLALRRARLEHARGDVPRRIGFKQRRAA